MPTNPWNSNIELIEGSEDVIASVANRPLKRLFENALFNKETWEEWLADPAVSNDFEVDANLHITGDLVVDGDSTQVNVSDMSIDDNTIVLNDGESNDGVTLGTAGLEVDRGANWSPATFLFNEDNDTWEGKIGSDYIDLKINQLIATGGIDISTTNQMKLGNNDYLRFDDTNDILYLDVDGGSSNGQFHDADTVDGQHNTDFAEYVSDVNNKRAGYAVYAP